jgi:gamma-glutamylaminecyclotransferase
MKKEDKFKVAVYGSLRKGLSNHRLLEQSKFLGTFETPPEYSMYSIGLAFPGLKSNGSTSIVMEVYEVDEYTLGRLDMLEGYRKGAEDSNHYNKKTMQSPFGEVAWYEYNKPITDKIKVEEGDWTEFKNLHKNL